MLNYNTIYNIYTASGKDRRFEELVDELLKECLSNNDTIVQLTFFGSSSDNKEYTHQRNTILDKAESIFGSKIPSISYVAQKPLVGDLVLEVGKLPNSHGQINYKSYEDINYIELDTRTTKTLVINIHPKNIQSDIKSQSREVFEQLENILTIEGYDINSIVRQWNYIERITDFEGEHQHYQSFNDARSHFYSKAQWNFGYPAATGIGTQYGGIMIDVIAIKPKRDEYRCVPLNNDLQVAAYDYSQDVLLGADDEVFRKKSTPKFERAKAITNDKHGLVYISGTAAIRGENSLTNVSIEEQTRITLENINYLISKENLNKTGIEIKNNCSIDMLRIYLKDEEDIDVVKNYMDSLSLSIPVSYLLADVCREELLIELEGIASFPAPV